MISWFRTFFLAFIVLLFVGQQATPQASAGTFTLKELNYSADKFIPRFHFQGVVNIGDEKQIEALLKRFANCRLDCYDNFGKSSAVLTLNSGGGSYITGLKIAKLLRRYRVATVVENGAKCYSACAFAFLGGTGYSTQKGLGEYIDRTVEPGAVVGFHAPYFPDKALMKFVKDNRLPEVLNGTRQNIALMVESLVDWNVDKKVIARMVSMGPNQTYNLARPVDLFLARSSLPQAPVSAWQPDARKGLRNVCLRLVALQNSISLREANSLLGQKYIERFGKGKLTGVISGYRVQSDDVFGVKVCAIAGSLAQATSSSNYHIALYSGPGVDGSYNTALSFFNRAKGWSSVGTGTKETARIFQKGNMSHYFLDPFVDLAKLKTGAALNMLADRFFVLTDNKLPKANPLLKIVSQTRSTRISVLGKVIMFEQIGSAKLFDMAKIQVSAKAATLQGKAERSNSFYRNGKYNDGAGNFNWIGFKNQRRSILYRIEVLNNNMTDQEKKLVSKLACSATFKGMRLQCK